jgi:hypothetical protein
VGLFVVRAADQTWGANAGTAWYTGTNWAGGAFPGLQGVAASNTDGATWTSAATATTFGINMGSGNSLNLGAIIIDSTRSTATNIGDSSATAGSLRLYGKTVNGIPNVIIRHNGTGLLTLQAAQSGTMGVVLSNATENIINIDNTGGVAVSSIISGSGMKLTRGGAGTGTLTLTGVNTYSGDTNINAGKLALTGAGSLANSPNIIVAGGATFDVSGLTTQLTLQNAQTLRASGSGTSGTIATTTSKGLTLGATSGLQFTAYNGSAAPLTVAGAGSVTLAPGNVVVVTVPGSPLGIGDYKLIASGGAPNVTAVNGTAPTAVTVNGAGGLAGGTTASLVISGGELFLHVVAAATGQMRVTLPGETWTSGSGNSGTATTQTAGTPFNLTLTATLPDGITTDTAYAGPKTINYSGPGGSPSYTTSVNFTSGQATGVATTLTLAQTTTITASDGTLTGVASSSLLVNPGAVNSYVVSASSPQAQNVAFNTVVTAKDANSNTVTTDSSTAVTMTSASGNMQFDSNGDSTFGDNTKTLSNGTFTINTKDNVAETTTITATDANTKTGTSASIVVADLTVNTDFFRSNTVAGSWSSATSWESSHDGTTNWITATLAPNNNASTVTIRNGHTISVAAAVTVDDVVIASGGNLTLNSGVTLTVNNGSGDDIIVQSGGIFVLTANPSFNASASANINTGGTLRVAATGLTGNGAGVNAANFVYQDASILDYSITSTFSASGVTYFPNVNATTIPIFRLTATPGNPGGASNTVINGVFEVTTGNSVTWAGTGTKTFRNGIRGAGNIDEGASGQFLITGASAELGGSGTLTLGAAGLQVSTTSATTLTSNKSVNTNTLTVAGTLNCGTNALTGSSAFTLSSGATLGLGSPAGISSTAGTGNIQLTGTRTFSTGATYVYNGSADQVVGNQLPSSVANLTIANIGPGGNNTVTGNTGQTVTALLRIQSGVYTGASSYNDVQIDNGATLEATAAGTINVGGNWTNNGGTFTPSTGTVNFNSTTATQTIGGTATSQTFNNLTVTKSGQTLTVSGGTTALTIINAFDVSAGTFSQGAVDITSGPITIASGATYQNLGTGDLTLTGNVTNSGTINFNGNGGSCGDADSIVISSSASGTQRTWSGSGTFSMTDVAVSDQRTPVVPPPAAIFVTSGTDSGNNTGWFFSGTCTAGTYTWVGGVNADWQVPTNWSPTRTVPATGDVLLLDGNAAPAPIISNVPTQTIAALRLVNSVTPTLNASSVSPPQTLTLNGATGTDLSVPSGTALTVAGANALKISVAAGSTGVVGGQIVFQDGAHRLLGNAAGAVTFQSGALFTTTSGFSGNAFGSGAAADGTAASIIFASGSIYFHNAGDSPFGVLPNAAVVTFQTGSEADFFTTTGFQASGRTYANLKIGKGDPSGVALNPVVGGSGNFQFDNLIIQNTDTANSSLTFNGTGANTITIRGNITSVAAGAGGTAPDVVFTAGSGGIVIDKQGGGTITFGNILNTRGMEFESSATVASGTTLTLARKLLLGISQPNSLVMKVDGDIAGSASGYVIGSVRKSAVPVGSFVFPVGKIAGYTPLDLANASGGGDLTVQPVDAVEPVLSSSTSLKEYWNLTLNSGTLTSDLTFHYLDADVNGAEPNYEVIVVESGNATRFPADAEHTVNTSGNTFTVSAVQSFSHWTVGEPNAPTAVKLAGFRAIENNGEVMLQWQTGFEARNLGYNIYREQNGKRVAITPSLVAGSALVAGRQTRLGAGLSYAWYDKPGQDSEFKGQNSRTQDSGLRTQDSAVSYWLEDVDLNGTRTLHGPIVPEVGFVKQSRGQQRADLISEVAQRTSPSGVQFSGWAAASRSQSLGQSPLSASKLEMRADPSDMQRDIAGMAGVKIAVSRAGWYRVTQAELAAAGFSVADAKQLQLYRNGREVAISVSSNDSFTANDYLEFYGEGIDSPTDNAQTYYLVNGKGRGARINVSSVSGKAAAAGPQSFAYTAERKERMIYFSGLRNGDAENFFGQIVSSDPISATLPVSNIEANGPAAQLEVVLQGVTSESHLVHVLLNGADLGTINFSNTDHPSQTFAVPASALYDGDNTVELTSLGGASDVSLVDVMRLTYNRGFVAQDNALAFSVAGQQGVRLSGFTNPNVRVFDISDSSAVSELKPLVSMSTDGGGYTAYVEVRQASALSPHSLLALAGVASQPADSVIANTPSSWWSQTAGANYVIVANATLKAALEPLAQFRRAQGMTVAVVDVEDIYDEFSFGKHSPEAIRSFLQRANKSWKRQPHFVLLAGDASYDPKNYLGQGLNDLVPTRLVDTALNETASDDWLSDFNGDGIGDLAVGRLPVRTAAEAAALVTKIISYENASPDPSRGALLVADTHFEAPSKAVQNLMPAGLPVQTVNRSDTDDATAHNQVIASINQGPRVANYFGHGSNGIWSGAGLLSSNDTAALTNNHRLSVFTMMTCFNGYFQDPYNDSLSEALLKSPGGAVAVWASTTLTEPDGQTVIGAEFYRLLFGAQPITLGDAARAAKSVTSDADVRRTWTLFGDPALRLK